MKSFTEVKPIHINQIDDTEKEAFATLYCSLEKGIQSMKNGETYTIDEAWVEIDNL